MKKSLVLSLIVIVYGVQLYAFDIRAIVGSCEFSYRELSPHEHQLTCKTYFKLGSYCPPIAGYDYAKRSDTLFVKIYYDARRSGAAIESECLKKDDTTIQDSLLDVSHVNYSMSVLRENRADHSLNDTFSWIRDSTFALRSSSVEEMYAQERASIFPNPAITSVTIPVPATITAATVQLSSLAGVAILKKKVEPGTTETKLDLRSVPAGIYWVQLFYSGRLVRTQKLFKTE